MDPFVSRFSCSYATPVRALIRRRPMVDTKYGKTAPNLLLLPDVSTGMQLGKVLLRFFPPLTGFCAARCEQIDPERGED
jgi:hypothetical protein